MEIKKEIDKILLSGAEYNFILQLTFQEQQTFA
jgi:hypothetical protein